MPSKKRRDLITIDGKGLRFRVWAAIADIPELRTQSLTTAIAWLVHYALDILYRGRQMTLSGLIERKLYDKKYPWALLEGDPKAAVAMLAETAALTSEEIWFLLKGEASPTEEQLSSLASAFEMDIEEVIAIAEGKGPRINGDVHVEQRI